MKVLVATEKPFAAVAVKGIRDIVEGAGHELALLEKYTETEQLLEAVADADALIIRSDKVTAEVMAAAPQLKIVVRAGAGYDNVDLQAATERGICVMNTPGQNSNAVAELAVAMLLFQIRCRFNGKAGTELRGKRLGLVGFGHVARCLAHIAEGMGMHTQAWVYPRRLEETREQGYNVTGDMAELFSQSDVVSLHIPFKQETAGVINYNLLSRLPKGGIVVNTARKEVVDEEDLLRIMEERQDIVYLTDIQPTCHEQMQQRFTDRYFATPKKMGAQTAEANVNAGLAAAQQICNFFASGDETFRVN